MCKSLKQLKHALTLAIHIIKCSVCCLDANKVFLFTLSIIGISATHLMLNFTYSTLGHALTSCWIPNEIVFVLIVYGYSSGQSKSNDYNYMCTLT